MALSLKQKAILKALEGNYCNVSKACKEVGISRKTHYHYLEQNTQYATLYAELQEQLIDELETTAFEMAKIEPRTLEFMLKSKGKKRGYGDKIDVNHSGTITKIEETIIDPQS